MAFMCQVCVGGNNLGGLIRMVVFLLLNCGFRTRLLVSYLTDNSFLIYLMSS
jgi:hypothetical protein